MVEKNKAVSEETKVIPDNSSSQQNEERIETSSSGSNSLGVSGSEKATKLEEDGANISSIVKFDDKFDEHVTELLQSKLNTSVQDVKKDFLIIFGLFASFVTFISINVQVFKNNDNIFELLGICSISLSFIIFFTIIINQIVKDNLEWKDFFKPVFLLTLIFLIIGVVFLNIGDSKNVEKIREIETRIIKDSIQLSISKSDIIILYNKLSISESETLNLKGKIDSIEIKQNDDTIKYQISQPEIRKIK